MNYHKHLDNWRLFDEETAIDELLLYKRNGGLTVADVTPKSLGRDPLALARVARATGLNIIMGTAYYVDEAHPKEVQTSTVKEIASGFVRDIAVGAEGTGVRAGIIGEIGCSWPLTGNEAKVLRAAATAQQETGAPLMIHPGRNESAPLEIIDILRDAGADLNRTIICHISRTLFNSKSRLELAEAGCYLEYDLFGRETFVYGPTSIELPNDGERIEQIRALIAEGYETKILVAHDICRKTQLTRYGGFGYAYILRYGVPMMLRHGMSESQIHSLLVDNPKKAMSFSAC